MASYVSHHLFTLHNKTVMVCSNSSLLELCSSGPTYLPFLASAKLTLALKLWMPVKLPRAAAMAAPHKKSEIHF